MLHAYTVYTRLYSHTVSCKEIIKKITNNRIEIRCCVHSDGKHVRISHIDCASENYITEKYDATKMPRQSQNTGPKMMGGECGKLSLLASQYDGKDVKWDQNSHSPYFDADGGHDGTINFIGIQCVGTRTRSPSIPLSFNSIVVFASSCGLSLRKEYAHIFLHSFRTDDFLVQCVAYWLLNAHKRNYSVLAFHGWTELHMHTAQIQAKKEHWL